jgi:hypothetical protein
LLSSDEARCSVIPLWRMTLGIKGHWPVVGDLDCHELVYVFGALNRVTGQLTPRIIEQRRVSAKRQKTSSRQRRLQEAFARHWRVIARAYPAEQSPRAEAS